MASDGRRGGLLPGGRRLVLLVVIGFFLAGAAAGIVADRTLFGVDRPAIIRVVKVVPADGREPARACEALPSFFGRCADRLGR